MTVWSNFRREYEKTLKSLTIVKTHLRCSTVQWIEVMNGLMGLRNKDNDEELIMFYSRNGQQTFKKSQRVDTEIIEL